MCLIIDRLRYTTVSDISFVSFTPVSNIAAVISYTHVHILNYGPIAYCDNRFHAAVDTKNGTELINKLLKHRIFPQKKMMTPSADTLIIDSFLPKRYQSIYF